MNKIFLDHFVVRRKFKVETKHKNSSKKIKITKPFRFSKTEKIFSGLIVIFLIVLCGALIGQSKYYKLFVLAKSIQNEKILIGFQNSAELRPTGGFWGSFAILKANKNLLDSELDFETNPYKSSKTADVTAQLPTALPKPMAETWPDAPMGFVNANWSPDFTEAGKSIEWQFALGWGENVNGVVAVSSLSMIDLLKLTGPIIAKDGTVISSDNFTEIMSQKIDTDYFQNPENVATNEPKTILKEIAPQIIEKTKNVSKIKLIEFLNSQIQKGRLLAYFNDSKREKISENLGISGELLPNDQDYLSIVNANLNGGKSSLNVIESSNYKIEQNGDDVSGELTITRKMDDSWPNILNRNYTRVFTPLGSKLISASLDGSDITNSVETLQESGKTSFGLWFSVGPNENHTAILKYSLPFSLKNLNDYRLVLQKQPGTNPETMSISVGDTKLYDGVLDQSLLRLK